MDAKLSCDSETWGTIILAVCGGTGALGLGVDMLKDNVRTGDNLFLTSANLSILPCNSSLTRACLRTGGLTLLPPSPGIPQNHLALPSPSPAPNSNSFPLTFPSSSPSLRLRIRHLQHPHLSFLEIFIQIPS